MNPRAVVTVCANIRCKKFWGKLNFTPNIRRYDGHEFSCAFCRRAFNIRPPIFRGLHANYADLSDALVYFLNGCSVKTILKNIPALSRGTLYTFKLRFEALIVKGDKEFFPEIVLGGNAGNNRVEVDDLVAGRKRKGRFGHATQVLNNVWGARGICSTSGRKKWILKPFYLGIGREVGEEDIENFMERHIADETFLICDKGKGYAAWARKTEKKLLYKPVNHSKGEFVKKDVEIMDFLGNKLLVKLHTNDVEGGWKDFRLAILNQGGVRQARMLGFCHRLMFFFNHRGENLLFCFADYMHLDVGSSKKCRTILKWKHGYVYRNKIKKQKNAEKKAVPPLKWKCPHCPAEVENTAGSRSQHRIYFCAVTRRKTKTVRKKRNPFISS